MNLIDSHILQQEQNARDKYLAAVQGLGANVLPGWFNDLLEHHILPLLVRVGFDREITSSIFQISAPAWKSMGPAAGQNLRLLPVLARDIWKIRRDIISHDNRTSAELSFPAEASPQAMHPAHLRELLQTIPTTWIILPRAHSFLTRGDSLYLIVYLQHLDRETNRAFEKVLVRILIEFIANYSLKFINSSLPKKQLCEAFFYGYAAMFWKNLRQPPPGLEDLLVFRNYLSWVKTFNKRAPRPDAEKEAVIADMEEMGNRVLPEQRVPARANMKVEDAHALQISLRHGRPGITHAVHYFSMNTALFRHGSRDHLSYTTLPRQINTFFRELRTSYNLETPKTREFIHTFLMELNGNYGSRPVPPEASRHQIPDNLAFTRGRMAHLIQDFSQSMH